MDIAKFLLIHFLINQLNKFLITSIFTKITYKANSEEVLLVQLKGYLVHLFLMKNYII